VIEVIQTLEGKDEHDVRHRQCVYLLWKMIIQLKDGELEDSFVQDVDLFLNNYRDWAVAKRFCRPTAPFVELLLEERGRLR
jgi:hypothetical protein